MRKKKVLVAPLDWGLGHATRCIPVIRALQDAGHEVMIACDGAIKHLLVEEFPDLTFRKLKGYGLSYSSRLPAWLMVLLLIPRIAFSALREHSWLKRFIETESPDVVISDNRFGLYNKKVCTVYITHQIMIKSPAGFKWAETLLYRMHRWLIGKYGFCWIPDYAGTNNLSGDLGHRYPLPPNVRYINPLSRFSAVSETNGASYDLCAVVSGPEPARRIFEKKILSALRGYPGKAMVILGEPGRKQDKTAGNIRMVSHLPAKQLGEILASSGYVVCRPGYSGIMDLLVLRKEALLVPTPGQTEQEYLAGYLSDKNYFRTLRQSEFTLENAAPGNEASVNRFRAPENGDPLRDAVAAVMDCADNTPA